MHCISYLKIMIVYDLLALGQLHTLSISKNFVMSMRYESRTISSYNISELFLAKATYIRGRRVGGSAGISLLACKVKAEV